VTIIAPVHDLESKEAGSLRRLSEELRQIPRHLWDEHLWSFCERLLSQRSAMNATAHPMRAAPEAISERPERA
jgi:hypothetical protein